MQRVWEQAAGAAIAREAAPVSERAGTVTLQCSSAVWMAEIDLMGPTLVAQLNALLGAERVSGGSLRRDDRSPRAAERAWVSGVRGARQPLRRRIPGASRLQNARFAGIL